MQYAESVREVVNCNKLKKFFVTSFSYKYCTYSIRH